jgi:hypothetical protein
MESDMSEDHYEHQPEHHGDYTPAPEYHQNHEQAEAPAAEVAVEAPAEAEAVAEDPKPDPILARLDAIDASLADLRAGIDELKAAQAVVVVEPVVAVSVADAAPADVAAAEPVVVAKPAAVAVDHSARFDALEAAVAELSASLGQVHAGVVALSGDVADHRTLHASTQAMIDEQHNLMRGLNYIITAAIGTLTAAAKPGK